MPYPLVKILYQIWEQIIFKEKRRADIKFNQECYNFENKVGEVDFTKAR
jgi:hypothetical protein